MEEELETLESILSEIQQDLSGYFRRRDAYCAASDYIKGLLSKVERKNSWQIAEGTGHVTPYRFQNMINRATWDEDKVRDYKQALVIKNLGFDGVAVIDETGFLKKGTKSAGVKRQYSRTAGRIENSQVGVFMGWKTSKGHALIDRELYIPQDWIKDQKRCEEAGIPKGQKFYTKPKLASLMYKRLIANGHSPSWVTADEAYGRDSEFCGVLESYNQPYVLAIPRDHYVRVGLIKLKAEKWCSRLTDKDWHRLSCGKGSKGERLYDWALMKREEACKDDFQRYLLIRRSISDPNDLAFYTIFAKKVATLQEIITVAGQRWSIEECFEIAKGETGLDQYEVRTMKGWYRHITLSMIAFSILTITRAKRLPPCRNGTLDDFKKKRKK